MHQSDSNVAGSNGISQLISAVRIAPWNLSMCDKGVEARTFCTGLTLLVSVFHTIVQNQVSYQWDLLFGIAALKKSVVLFVVLSDYVMAA